MDETSFRMLMGPHGQEALQTAQALAPKEADFLSFFSLLCRRFPPELSRAALEIAILRSEARSKFPFAEKMYFTRQALEQASGYDIASHRARRFAGFKQLLDLGCSVGSDTLALASQAPTLGIELDPLRLCMAQANLKALGAEKNANFVQADLRTAIPVALPSGSGLFFDPARRSGQQRIFSVNHYQPPLSIVHEWLPRCSSLGVKISPGVDLDELQQYDAEIEFISLHGELKEAVLWFGPLKTTTRRATLLPGPHTLTWEERPAGDPLRQPAPVTSEPCRYIYEPDPAVLRAGLVQKLAGQLDAVQMDPDIAYLTSDSLSNTPFARVWETSAWLPFNLKHLRAVLRQRNIGKVTIKKRGSPLQPEALERDLRLTGSEEMILFLTHLRGRPIVILAQPASKRAA